MEIGSIEWWVVFRIEGENAIAGNSNIFDSKTVKTKIL